MTRAGQEKVKQIITDRILEQLAQGVIPWKKPWVGTAGAWNRRNGKPYNLLNQFLLDGCGEYATFNAIKKEGGHIKKGAKGQYVLEFFCNERELKDKDGNVMLNEDGEPETKKWWSMRYENVFNIARDTDLAVKHNVEVKKFDGKPIDVAENCFMHYINTHGIQFLTDTEGRAYYSPLADMIHLPNMDQFEVVEEYYSTAFHEAAHSTGHGTRLDRLTGGGFGSESYGKEELVAELTSAAICNTLGIEVDSTFQNSASYIDNWTKAIKGGEADIISASTFADKAYAMILDGFEYEPDPVSALRDELDELTREYNERFRKYWRVDRWSGTGSVVITHDDPVSDWLDERKLFGKIEQVQSEIDRMEKEYASSEA